MNIEQAFQISLVDFLARLGHKPVRVRGYKYWYFSPFRTESEPSFKVNTEKNLWYDFGEGIGGGIIILAKRMLGTNDVASILSRLQEQSGIPFNFIAKEPPRIRQREKPAMRNFTTLPLTHYALTGYLERRGIPLHIGRKYCGEAHYELGGKKYFALAFANDSGGYELRNPYFKGCMGRKDITVHRAAPNPKAAVRACRIFEGFFDYLAYLTLVRIGIFHVSEQELTDYVILNSVSNLSKVITMLEDYNCIYTYLDNDRAGEKATELMKQKYAGKLHDMSAAYGSFKDLNELLCHS